MPERGRSGRRGPRLTGDARWIVAAQAARALAYGLGSVLIGVTLARRGLSGGEVGLVLAGLLAGVALRGSLGAPFVIAGLLKCVYDCGLYVLFRRVPVQWPEATGR